MENLILKDNLKKEELNKIVFDADISKKNTYFYMLILDAACNLGIVSEAMRESIFKNILKIIESETALRNTNNSWILSFYLQTMSNCEAFELLKNATPELLATALSYYKKTLAKSKRALQKCRASVEKLNNSNLKQEYSQLSATVSNLSDLNHFLIEKSSLLGIILLHEVTGNNLLDLLFKTITAFSKECCILENINLEIANFESNIEKDDDFHYEAKKEKIKKTYHKKLKQFEEEQKKFDEEYEIAEKNFRAKNSHLSEEELETAVDEFLDSFEPKTKLEYLDSIELENWYHRQLRVLDRKFEEFEQKKQKEVARKPEIDLNAMIFNPLERVIFEFAVYDLYQKGEITYPETDEDKFEIYSSAKFNIKDYIPGFIKQVEKNLTKKDKDYLLN